MFPTRPRHPCAGLDRCLCLMAAYHVLLTRTSRRGLLGEAMGPVARPGPHIRNVPCPCHAVRAASGMAGGAAPGGSCHMALALPQQAEAATCRARSRPRTLLVPARCPAQRSDGTRAAFVRIEGCGGAALHVVGRCCKGSADCLLPVFRSGQL